MSVSSREYIEPNKLVRSLSVLEPVGIEVMKFIFLQNITTFFKDTFADSPADSPAPLLFV